MAIAMVALSSVSRQVLGQDARLSNRGRAGTLTKSIDSRLSGVSTRPFPAYSIHRASLLLIMALPDAVAKP